MPFGMASEAGKGIMYCKLHPANTVERLCMAAGGDIACFQIISASRVSLHTACCRHLKKNNTKAVRKINCQWFM